MKSQRWVPRYSRRSLLALIGGAAVGSAALAACGQHVASPGATGQSASASQAAAVTQASQPSSTSRGASAVASSGQSFASVLSKPGLPGKPFVFGEYALPHRPFFIVRDDRWKYVYYTDTTVGRSATTGQKEPAEELYDTANDPAELTNLAGAGLTS